MIQTAARQKAYDEKVAHAEQLAKGVLDELEKENEKIPDASHGGKAAGTRGGADKKDKDGKKDGKEGGKEGGESSGSWPTWAYVASCFGGLAVLLGGAYVARAKCAGDQKSEAHFARAT